uniref:Uncharacterized protein n=1 Tax=Tanacetum cinerariifolium TaxID=118510 RepID=A0A6L2MT43_TANCI|nr:hypothetical protein [Tanacetum cinerariifolium]
MLNNYFFIDYRITICLTSVESVGSSFPRFILICSISIKVPIAPELGAAVVASPAGVLELDTHLSSEADPSESLLPPIPTAPILSAPSTIVAPSSEFPLAPIVAPPEIHRRRAILIRPREDIPIGRLYRTHPGGSCKTLTTRKSVRPFASHRLALSSGHSLSGHTPLDTIDADSSTPSRFVHPPLARTLRCSEAYLHHLVRDVGPLLLSSIHATRALVLSSADLLPPRKRFKDSISPEDSVKEDIDTDVLEDIEVDATAVKVAVDRDVKAGVDASIGMEVDVGIDVEDEVESSDRGTMEVEVDMVAGIDIPDSMLMPDVVERWEQVEEALQDIYVHVIEIPLQRIEDIETRQRELEARSLIAGGERASLLKQVAFLERSNTRLRGTMMMVRARADRFQRRVRLMKSELRQIYRFRYYKRMRFKRLETFTVRHLALATYEATCAANALEAESQSQNGSDNDNENGGDGNGGNGNGGNKNPNENNRDARHVS